MDRLEKIARALESALLYSFSLIAVSCCTAIFGPIGLAVGLAAFGLPILTFAAKVAWRFRRLLLSLAISLGVYSLIGLPGAGLLVKAVQFLSNR